MSSVADSFVDTASKKVSSSLPSGGVNCSPRLLVLDNRFGRADEFGDGMHMAIASALSMFDNKLAPFWNEGKALEQERGH